MSQSTTTTSSGPGLATLLGVLFIALKLTGVITWSWIWVLAPFWIGFAVFAVVAVLFLAIAALAALVAAKR